MKGCLLCIRGVVLLESEEEGSNPVTSTTR
jgi:hypothetical protein